MAVLAAAFAGCAPTAIYSDGAANAAAISPRSQWRASGNLDNPQAAIDGSISTAATAATQANAALTIDLGKPSLFNLVTIDHGAAEMGFARSTAVLTSNDGREFRLQHVTAGTRRVTTVWLASPVLARYVRLQVVVPGQQPWSLAEVYLK